MDFLIAAQGGAAVLAVAFPQLAPRRPLRAQGSHAARRRADRRPRRARQARALRSRRAPGCARSGSLDRVSSTFEDPAADTAFLRRLAADLVGRGSDADDLAQDAWIELLERGGAVRSARPWFRGVLRHLYWRSLRRRHVALAEDVEADGDPGPALEREEVLRGVRDAVAGLAEREAQVVRLRYFEGLSAREIAARSGRPLKTVQGQLARAREALRDRLRERWGRDEREWMPALWLAAGAKREQAAGAVGTAGGRLGRAACWAAAGAALAVVVALGHRAPRRAERLVAAAPPAQTERTAAPAPPAATPRVPATGAEPAAALAASAPAEPTWTIEVVDPGGARVEADVFLADAGGRMFRLGRSGTGAGLAVRPRDFREGRSHLGLLAVAPGRAASLLHFVPLPSDAPLPPGEAPRTVRIPVGDAAACVRGRALRADDSGAAGADVWLQPRKSVEFVRIGDVEAVATMLWTRADAGGRFELPPAQDGTYTLQVEAPRHVVERSLVTLWAGEDLELELRLRPAARLSGTVRDASGAPVEGALVRAFAHAMAEGEREFARSGPGGRYELDGVEPGPRPVLAQPADDPAFAARAFLDFSAGEDVAWDPVLARSAGLRIRAVDAEGAPLAGWEVLLAINRETYSWVHAVDLDANGRTTVHGHPLDPLDVHLRAPGVGTRLPYLVLRGVDPAAELLLRLAGPREPGRVAGWVVDTSGEPWSGAVVLCDLETTSPHVVPTDGDGRFVLEGVPPRPFQLLAMTGPSGFADFGVVAALPGEDVDVGTQVLPAAGALRTSGDWPAGLGHTLEQVPGGGSGWVPVAQAAGPPPPAWPLLPGRYRLQRTGGEGPREAWTFEVRAGEETVLDLALPR